MKSASSTLQRLERIVGLVATVSVLSWFLPPITTAAERGGAKPPERPAAIKLSDARLRVLWQKEMAKVPLPKKGCFTASYPKKEWREVPCGPPSPYPNGPAKGPRPNTIGNGTDLSAQTPGLLISSAVGSFDSVTPNTVTETGLWSGNATSPNAFTLQINSQFFTTSVCAGHAGCQGWQQFIYSQNQCGGPCVFMEYWLINFGSTCPTGPWISRPGNNCFFNSANTTAPAVTAAQLQGTTLTGTAASGGTDSVVLTSAGGTATAMAADSVVNLGQAWNTAEFNIFGDCCNAQANFSAGTTIVPRITLTDGSNKAPTCVVNGFTAETNNLSFGPNAPAASGAGPALLFTQSSGGGAMGCAAATSIGDTHLTTFGGTLYDFQASGDFTLAQTANPDFIVQARQVSGAPTWPNASVNKAVAIRMAKTRVAVCLPPTGLVIDGKPTEVEDGKMLELPDGADVSRHGNVYLIRDASGNSVRAEVNDPYINVSVGVGRWPANVHGVLANARGNVNEIAARDGAVLTAPFPFGNLYHHYADSWRVATGESLLSACGEGKIEPGLPRAPFYPKDLPPKTYKSARAVCTAAGVKVKALLDACTLDVAVIGRESAAKVFAGVRAPAAVGDAGSGHR